MTASSPTLGGFIEWARSVMGITPTILPDASPSWAYAYDVAVALVNQALVAVPPIYMLATYNLAGSNLLNWAQDPTPIVIYPVGSNSTVGFFTYTRQQLGMNSFTPGVLQSTGDESTNSAFMVPRALENLTLADLQLLKDPYGRTYLGFAQRYGTLWGLS